MMKFSVAHLQYPQRFSHLTRRMVIHELKEKLHGLSAMSCSCRRCRV
jgi:hypothetical protein